MMVISVQKLLLILLHDELLTRMLFSDINECATRKHACNEHQICINKEGTYACEGPSGLPHDDDLCARGFTYVRQRRRCEGIF